MPNFRTPEGATVWLPDDAADAASRAGYEPESIGEEILRAETAGKLAPYEGVGGTIKAGTQGLLRGASLGLTDALQRAGGTPAEDLKLLKEAHPGVSTATEILGGALPAIIPGGQFTASGALSRGALGVTERLAPEGASALRSIAGATAGGAIEGAGQGAGSYISDVALGDKKLSAEGFLASSGKGALWGGLGGGALSGIEQGTIAARRLFPKSKLGGKEAVEAATEDFLAKSDDIIKGADELEKTARQKLDDLSVRRAELNLEKEKLRGVKTTEGRERLQAIKVEQAKLKVQRGAQMDAVAAEKAAKNAVKPGTASEVLPTAHDVAPTMDDIGASDVVEEAAKQGIDQGQQAIGTPPMSSLELQLAATKDLLDQGHTLEEVNALGKADTAASIAEQDAAHSAGLLADTAAKQADEAHASLAAQVDDLAARKQAVKDYADRLRSKGNRVEETGREISYRPLQEASDVLGLPASHRSGKVVTPVGEQDVGGRATDWVLAGEKAPHALDEGYQSAIERAANAASHAEQTVAVKEAADIEKQIMSVVEERGGRDAERLANIRKARQEMGLTEEAIASRRAEKLALGEMEGPMTTGKANADTAYDTAIQQSERAMGETPGARAASLLAPTKKSVADQILEGGKVIDLRPMLPPSEGRFVDDAAEAVKVIGDFEKSHHDLTQALGPAAPPAAQAHAAQYATALDDQSRKVAAKAAMSADDIAKGVSTIAPGAAPAAKKGLRELAADVMPSKGIAGKAMDLFSALETANELGATIPGMPNVKDIPVVGPMLSMYLKLRAGKALLHRLGGRIPATAEAKVAAKSAAMRDAIAEVADRLLEGTGKVAQAARRVSAPVAVKAAETLSHSLYPIDEKREKPKNASDALKARVNELSTAVSNPEATKAAIRQAVPTNDPDVASAIEDATMRKLEYLQKNAPSGPPPGFGRASDWHPSKSDIAQFARRMRAAEDPISVLHDIEADRLTPEAADTLRAVYPQMFAEVQQRLIERAGELQVKLPYPKLVQLSVLFQAPLDDSLRPENVAGLQEALTGASPAGQGPGPAAQPGQPPVPSIAAPVHMAQIVDPESRRSRR